VTRSYRAVAIIEDPGPPLTIRLGGRERRVPSVLEPLVAPLKYLRQYRRRRLLRRQVDRFAAILEDELPGGMSHPEFQERVLDRMHEWLSEHPSK
jgi:hypothetical protein